MLQIVMRILLLEMQILFRSSSNRTFSGVYIISQTSTKNLCCGQPLEFCGSFGDLELCYDFIVLCLSDHFWMVLSKSELFYDHKLLFFDLWLWKSSELDSTLEMIRLFKHDVI